MALTLKIMNYDLGASQTINDGEQRLVDHLADRFPDEVDSSMSLTQAVAAVNQIAGFGAEVKIPDHGRNLLPENYLTHNQDDEDDPWPREADLDE